MNDFEFVWLCTARLEQTIDLLSEALSIDEDPEGTGEKTVETLGKARWFARLTRGFACAKLCDLARQTGLPNAESWNFEFASELQKLEQPPEIRPILADLHARHRALVTASESLLIGKRTPNERFPDCKFVWDLSLTMKYLRSALDEIERIDRDLLNHVPTCTFDEKRRASFDYTFWIRRAIRFPSERLAGIASRYGVSNQSFWNLEFSTRLDRLLHGMYDVNESIEMVIGFRHVWDPVRYVLLNDAFMTEEPTRRSEEPAEASLTQVEPAILPTTLLPCPVVLDVDKRKAFLRGVPIEGQLREEQLAVLNAFIKVWPMRMTKDEVERIVGVSDPLKCFKRLIENKPWSSLLSSAGRKGAMYGWRPDLVQ